MTRTVIQSDDIASGAVDSGLASVQTFTSSGTWTRTSGVTKVIVEVQGAGGGAGSGDNYPSQGGGGGGYVKKFINVSSISSATITVGAGGAGGVNANGADGGDSSWVDGTNTLTGGGGVGGIWTNNAYATFYIDNRGSATGGDFNIQGGCGEVDNGGSSSLGIGSYRLNANANAVDQATGYGSGGNRPANNVNSSNYNGGPGKEGIVIVTEYK
jgi:hypothetical protein